MKIMVFLHGTLIMHRNVLGLPREERVRQVKEGEESVLDFASYIPIGGAVKKLDGWKKQGAEIVYLSSHLNAGDVEKDKSVLKRFGFPKGVVLFRKNGEQYRDIIEGSAPDVLIEDDCESIGGAEEMAITHVRPELKKKIRSIVVKEFGGIDHLPDRISDLIK